MSRTDFLQAPELRPFLPLLLVAWSDGDLEPAELTALHEHVERTPWLRPAARIALRAWLDPAAPPTVGDIAALRSTLDRVAGTMARHRRRDLVALGLSMAGPDANEDTRKALTELEAQLGGPDDDGIDAPPEPSAPADSQRSAAMRTVLDGEHRETRDGIREFLSDPERRAYGLDTQAYRAKVTTWLDELAQAGFGALAFPGVTTEQPDLGAFFAAFETLALGDLSLLIKCGVQFGLFGGSIFFLGRPEQRAAYLPGAATLEIPGCFAMSEVGHGSDVQGLETEARWDAQARTFTIVTPSESARKDWIGGAAQTARIATVFANLVADGQRHGVHAFVVPIRAEDGALLPGVRAGDSGHKMGLNGVDNGRLWFEDVVVPEDALLGRFAQMDAQGRYESAIENPNRRFFTMLGTLVGGRVSVASGAVGVSKVGVAIAVRYASRRRQFGAKGEAEVPLLDYPQHRRRLLPHLASTYVLSLACAELQSRFAAAQREGTDGVPGDTREIESSAAILKALASQHAVDTLAECRRACGGQGYLSVNRIPALMNDVEIFTTFEGDNTVLLQLVARSLLAGLAKRFESKGLSGVVREVMRRTKAAAVEKNVVATRRVASDHLRDRDFHLAALRYREEHLLQTAGQRLRKRLSRGMPSNHAVLALQEHLVALAWAHADRLALEWFDLRVQAVRRTSPDLASELDRLGALHALGRIRAESGFYFSEGYIDPRKDSAMRKETELLLTEIRASALTLVDAFGIPDVALAAPIAFMDPAHPVW